jgi:hypothetical protein
MTERHPGFGGLSSSGGLSDTWTWDGTTWTEQTPKTSPPERYAAAMAGDLAAGNMVLFGGLEDRTMLADTWTWNGVTWTQQFPSSKPSARNDASITYDAATSNDVLFGGYNGGASALSDTWTWNGTTWTQQDPTQSPSGRYGASLTYDPATTYAVLFGGYNGGTSDLGDMWVWTGTMWAEQFPATSPPARRFAAMDYDEADQSLLLFGGDPGGESPSSLDDSWIWGSEGSFSSSPAQGSLVLGASNSDTAAVTGNAGAGAPTGTVSFYECGPTTTPEPCSAQAVAFGGPVTLTAGPGDTSTGTSTMFTPTAPGYWCFAVAYSGDTDYAPVTDTTDGCFTVDPPISVAPTTSSVVLGNPDGAVATVFGNATSGSPTGTVDFYTCGPTTAVEPCTSEANPLGSAVTLAPEGGYTSTAPSPFFTPTEPGYWCVAGVYSGDGNYASGSDTTTDGCFSVSPNFSAAATLPTIGLGSSDTDSATATGTSTGGVPTGSVTFYVCGPTSTPESCTSETNTVGSSVPLVPGGGDVATAHSASFTPSSLGSWCFASIYSGDGTYAANSDLTTDQCFTVEAVAPAFTSPATATGTAKEPLTVSISTSGGPAPDISATYLPTWLVLTDNGNGTATLRATKARRGRHRFFLTATNSAGSVTQDFTLTIEKRARD